METSAVLNRAADLIEERGWAGTNGLGWAAEGSDPVCVEGAISAAMGAEINQYGGFTSGPNLCPAGQAVRDYLELGLFVSVSQSHCLFQWNDETRLDLQRGMVNVRTAAEVIEVLRACALIEAAREEQDAAWETYAELVAP